MVDAAGPVDPTVREPEVVDAAESTTEDPTVRSEKGQYDIAFVSHCPLCAKSMAIPDPKLVMAAIKGAVVRLNCPICQKPIELAPKWKEENKQRIIIPSANRHERRAMTRNLRIAR